MLGKHKYKNGAKGNRVLVTFLKNEVLIRLNLQNSVKPDFLPLLLETRIREQDTREGT
jgi:hypothetical protein